MGCTTPKLSMQDLAFIQVGYRRQTDMRVRTYVEPLPGCKYMRPHLVEKNVGPHHAPLPGRQRSPDLEVVAKFVRAGHYDDIDGAIIRREIRHGPVSP